MESENASGFPFFFYLNNWIFGAIICFYVWFFAYHVESFFDKIWIYSIE